MGTIFKRGDSHRAVIRKVGHKVLTKTFSKHVLAKRWIAETELAMEKLELVSRHVDMAGIIRRYLDEDAALLTISASRLSMLRFLLGKTSKLMLDDLNAAGLIAWRKREVPHVKPVTFTHYLASFTTVLKTADVVWGMNVPWSDFKKARGHLRSIGMMAESGVRTRRPAVEELDAIKAHMKSDMPMADIIDFAIATALRTGEICKVRWDDIDYEKRLLLVRDRKHPKMRKGNHSLIPLLGDALAIILRQPHVDDRIFPYRGQSVQMAFSRARNSAGVKNLHLHDTRHESISRMFEMGYGIQEVALLSGHKSWNSLKRYTNLKPESLHRD